MFFSFSRQIPKSKVTVLGYGLLTSDAHVLTETLRKQKFKVVIIDESHYMKSRNATRSKILLPIVQNAIRAVLLTGTPALGRPEEVLKITLSFKTYEMHAMVKQLWVGEDVLWAYRVLHPLHVQMPFLTLIGGKHRVVISDV